jgi:trigger factor
MKLEEGEALSFVAVVEVKPSIDLGDVKGLEVQHAPGAIGDADVDQAVDTMREQQAEYRTVERPAAPGDLVIVDYTLTPEGQDPATANGYQFLIGSGAVFSEIDQAVVGASAGDERHVGLRFPDDYRVENLRGKSGTAAVKLLEVKEKALPGLDDDFAKSLGGTFDTLDAVRTEVRKQLEQRRAAEDKQALEDKLIDAVLGRHEFAVPEAMVMRHIAHRVEHARERMRRQGFDPDQIPWDYPKLVADMKPEAEKAVRRALVLEAIADRESLRPTDDDLEAEIDKIAQATQRPAPAVRRMMEKSGDLDGLRHGLRERMTLDYLTRHASIRS